MKKTNLDAAELYINRELSWLEFNDRVLREGMAKDVPPLERAEISGHRQLEPRRIFHDPRGRPEAAGPPRSPGRTPAA